jgi:hypothetical protein
MHSPLFVVDFNQAIIWKPKSNACPKPNYLLMRGPGQIASWSIMPKVMMIHCWNSTNQIRKLINELKSECPYFYYNRDIRKVRKRQHQYLEFGHTQGEIKKTCNAKQYISIQRGVKLRRPPCFPERLRCCYIDFHCSYVNSYYNSSRTLCIKCWDSPFRTEFQHFILRFNKISLLCGYH